MITKQLTGRGLWWTLHLQTCTCAYNSFASPALNELCLLHLTYGGPQKFLEIENNSLEGNLDLSRNTISYRGKKVAYFQKIVQDYRLQKLGMMNKDKSVTV